MASLADTGEELPVPEPGASLSVDFVQLDKARRTTGTSDGPNNDGDCAFMLNTHDFLAFSVNSVLTRLDCLIT